MKHNSLFLIFILLFYSCSEHNSESRSISHETTDSRDRNDEDSLGQYYCLEENIVRQVLENTHPLAVCSRITASNDFILLFFHHDKEYSINNVSNDTTICLLATSTIDSGILLFYDEYLPFYPHMLTSKSYQGARFLTRYTATYSVQEFRTIKDSIHAIVEDKRTFINNDIGRIFENDSSPKNTYLTWEEGQNLIRYFRKKFSNSSIKHNYADFLLSTMD